MTDVEKHRPMAVLCYFSILFGLPVFLAPLITRESPYALHHAKAAGVIYLLGTLFLVGALTNCALFLPLLFVCYIPALIGVHRAAAGAGAGAAAFGDAGERIFKRIEVKGGTKDKESREGGENR